MSLYEERPWLKNYPNGVPANIDPDQYSNLLDFFDEKFEQFADWPAFAYMGKTLTYRQLDQLSRRFAAYLQARGLEPGDRIAIMMPNILQYPVVLYGALRAGLIIVNTNPLYTPREMLHQFADSGPSKREKNTSGSVPAPDPTIPSCSNTREAPPACPKAQN